MGPWGVWAPGHVGSLNPWVLGDVWAPGHAGPWGVWAPRSMGPCGPWVLGTSGHPDAWISGSLEMCGHPDT